MNDYTHPSRYLPFALAIFLVGCQASEAPPPVTTASTTAGAAATSCPATTFEGFLKPFMDDVAVQKRYIAEPLESDTIDPNAEPEPAPVKKMLRKDQVSFPLMPGTARQHTDGLVLKTSAEGGAGYAVELAKPDTDYQMTFHFRSAEGCWQLYRTEDDSL